MCDRCDAVAAEFSEYTRRDLATGKRTKSTERNWQPREYKIAWL